MPQIALPAVELRAGQATVLVLDPVTLPEGRTLADWASFVVTLREDPLWPRRPFQAADDLDPPNDGWASAATGAGEVEGDTLELSFTAPALAGERRYALDVWGVGGTAGDVQLRQATWCNVYPSVR